MCRVTKLNIQTNKYDYRKQGTAMLAANLVNEENNYFSN